MRELVFFLYIKKGLNKTLKIAEYLYYQGPKYFAIT